MKKRFLSIFLTLCLALTLLPVTALAGGWGGSWAGLGSGDIGFNYGAAGHLVVTMPTTEGNYTYGTTSVDGLTVAETTVNAATLPADTSTWNWAVQKHAADTNGISYTLTLNNATISCTGNFDALMFYVSMNLNLIGTNYVSTAGSANTAVSGNNNNKLYISGLGSLSCLAGANGIGINIIASLTISSGTVTATGGYYGINVIGSTFAISGGTVTATGGSYGIVANSIAISGGAVTAKSAGQALFKSPTLTNCYATASTNEDGTGAVAYLSGSNDTYKYFHSVKVTLVSTEAELSSAVTNASDGDIIKLTASFSTSIIVQIHKTLTLDLNGQTINNSNFTVFKIGSTTVSDGNLTIIDSAGGGLITSPCSGRETIMNYGILTVSGGTVEHTATENSAILNATTGTLTVSGGTVQGAVLAPTITSYGTATISGGTVKNAGNWSAINNTSANLSISGGTIQSQSNMAIYNIATGTVDISGGTVQCIGNNCAIYSTSTGTITVRNTGTVISANTDTAIIKGTIYLQFGTSANTVLDIQGGTVSNTAGGNAVYNYASGVVTIASGATITGGLYPLTATPATGTASVAKTNATQTSVDFTLSNSVSYSANTIWYVYDAATGTASTTGVTAALSGSTLTLSHATNVTARSYYVAAFNRATGFGISTRLKLTVTNPSAAPTVTTGAASSVTATVATLNGAVNDNGATSSVSFEYGLTTSYGSSAVATPASVTAGAGSTAVSAVLSGLAPNTTYHFRVKAVNAAGTTNGADQTFTTPAAMPTVTTSAASGVSSTAATLNGTVNANNATSTVSFEYGLTTSYGSSAAATPASVTAGAGSTAVSYALSGLSPNTTYHFRVKAINSGGTTNGADQTFTTSAATPTGGTTDTTPLVTEIKNGGSTTGSNVGQLVSSGKTLTVDGDKGAKLLFDTEALKGISGQTSGDVKVEMKDVSTSHQITLPGKQVFSLTVSSGSNTITNFGGAVTVTLPYTLKDGETADKVTVWYLAGDGTRTEIPCTYNTATGLATFTITHFSLYVVGVDTPWVNPFTDVSENDWFYGAIEFVSRNGMMQGIGGTDFSPNTTVTRGMLVTILWRLEGEPATTKTISFADVSGSNWYAKAVAWAAEKNIVTGYAGKFNPDDALTREQLAAILYRYAAYKNYNVSAADSLSAYGDKPSDWAISSVSWAVAEGLIKGSGASLDPKGSATRAQAATILQRFLENTAK